MARDSGSMYEPGVGRGDIPRLPHMLAGVVSLESGEGIYQGCHICWLAWCTWSRERGYTKVATYAGLRRVPGGGGGDLPRVPPNNHSVATLEAEEGTEHGCDL